MKDYANEQLEITIFVSGKYLTSLHGPGKQIRSIVDLIETGHGSNRLSPFISLPDGIQFRAQSVTSYQVQEYKGES